MTKSLIFSDLEFTYPGSPDPVFSGVSLQLYPGWTAITGPNGVGKTTLMRLLCEKSRLRAVYVEQRTDEAPVGLADFLQAADGEAFWLRGVLGLSPDWADRWSALSHGERKRAQIGTALYARPDLLAVDEPTNHLDSAVQDFVAQALGRFSGFGLLVSHDRALLDRLCAHTIFMENGGAEMRRSAYSLAHAQRARENAHRVQQHKQQTQTIKKLKKQTQSQRQKADRSDRRVSKAHIDPRDRDAKTRIDLARLTGKDATDGKILARTQSRLAQAKEQLGRIRPEYETGITLDAGSPPGLFPLRISADRALQQGDRIGITGPNGSGKSTFIRQLVATRAFRPGELLYIPQEITADESARLLAAVKSMKPEEKGFLMSLIVRLGSDPKALLRSHRPSPGQTRKLMLALGLIQKPALIIMDEPTNHLDIVSIEALETALIDYTGTLVLVSHDRRFLEATTRELWRF